MNLVDAVNTAHDVESLRNAIIRELGEEVKGIDTNCTVRVVGLIRVDEDEVNRVHTGVVCLAKGVGGSIEDGTLEHDHGRMLQLDETVFRRRIYEPWSKVCIPHLKEMLLGHGDDIAVTDGG